MIRAVLDANVLVSAAIRPQGKPDQILRLHQRFVWLTCDAILSETEDVLGRQRIQKKYHLSAAQRTRYMAQLRALAILVPVTTVVDEITRDVDDNVVLACAVDGQADFLVSGDRHLLDLQVFGGIALVTPEQFLQLLGREPKQP
jgi:uncharacterized protein